MRTNIDITNFKRFLNKSVEVDIACYAYGFCYPENNVLVGMNESCFYFVADKDTSDEQYWHFCSNTSGVDDCSIDVFVNEN